jgi:hypothetical protein
MSDAALLGRIRTIDAASRGTYGAPGVHAGLQTEGTAVAHKRVTRLMRGAALRGIYRRRSPTTTQREPSHRPANDLAGRDFRSAGTNPLWVAGITYLLNLLRLIPPTFAGSDSTEKQGHFWGARHRRTELCSKPSQAAAKLQKPFAPERKWSVAPDNQMVV